jgi:hypothetical protein
VSKASDRVQLVEAVHLIDETHLIDARAPAVRATVDRSKDVVASANRELDRHRLWLERHQTLYSEALKECQRQLKRRSLIRAIKQTPLLPIQLLSTLCVAGFHAAWGYPHRLRPRAKLQNRIYAMEQLSGRRLPQPISSSSRVVRFLSWLLM